MTTMELPAHFPTYRIGFISPRDQSDTSSYEMYQMAPPELIAAYTQLGLSGFSEEAVESCLQENLERCVKRLARRQPQIMVFAGIPLQLFIDPAWNDRFKEMAAAEGAIGTTSLEAVIGAFRTIGVSRVAVVNKWTPDMNERLDRVATREGIELIGSSSEEIGLGNFDSTFESGALLALRLTEQVANDCPDAEAIWIAGGAWLTGPLVAAMEERFGKPVISAQQANPWYCMNRIGCYQPLEGRGSLLERTLVE